MPDETNDLLGNQQKDGPEAKKTDGQGMDGQVSEKGTADATNRSNAEAAPPEEEPVGSHRSEPRPVRKMSAADFKVRSEPKKGPIPSSKPPVQEPAQPAAAQKIPEPAPPEPRAPVQPQHEPIPEPTPPPKPAPPPEPVAVEPEPTWEPVKRAPVIDEPERWQKEEPRKQEPQGEDVAPGGIMDAIKGIFSFFTIIPIKVGGKEIQAVNKNFYLVPLVGLFIGMIAGLIGMVFYELKAVALAPVAVLATFYIISKFLHFDGLADFGDGMISSGDKEKCINALKDTRIGAGGLGIVVIVVLATYAGLSGILFPLLLAMVVVIMEVFVKNAMVAAAAFGEPGTGMASEQVRGTSLQTLIVSTALSAGLALGGYVVMGLIGNVVFDMGFLDNEPMITAILLVIGAAVASIFVGWLVAYLSNKKFGFVNGDCLGAANEISRVVILIVAIIVIGFYLSPTVMVVIPF